jgi:BTB/POZ domain/MATH domain
MSQRESEIDLRKARLVASVDIGDPPAPEFLDGDWEVLHFKFHSFEQMPQKTGEYKTTPALWAHGHPWKVRLYPRGIRSSNDKKEYISIYWSCESSPRNAPMTIAYVTCENGSRDFGFMTVAQSFYHPNRYGFTEFLSRESVISEYLKDGTLHVKIYFQVASAGKRWRPKKLQPQETLVQLHRNADFADVEFVVRGVSFKAHKCILWSRCPLLCTFVEETSNESVLIPGIEPSIFSILMEFIYTVKEPVLSNKEMAKSVLLQSDRFGIIGLKLLAESDLAQKFLSCYNAAELLVLADSRSCPLLREACLFMFRENPESVMASRSWQMIKESSDLLSDLLDVAISKPKDIVGLADMDVVFLRRRLEDANLDLDGSREMLIDRLKRHIAGSTDQDWKQNQKDGPLM